VKLPAPQQYLPGIHWYYSTLPSTYSSGIARHAHDFKRTRYRLMRPTLKARHRNVDTSRLGYSWMNKPSSAYWTLHSASTTARMVHFDFSPIPLSNSHLTVNLYSPPPSPPLPLHQTPTGALCNRPRPTTWFAAEMSLAPNYPIRSSHSRIPTSSTPAQRITTHTKAVRHIYPFQKQV
jgi:hypothetical protein